MRAAIHPETPLPETAPQELTLLDLVHAAATVAENDREAVAIVSGLLASGRVRLVGAFVGRHVAAAAEVPAL